MCARDRDTQILGARRSFQTTQWSLVRRAREEDALGKLIAIYWKPLYFFVRRRGHDNETAKDIVQGFLTTLLERDAFTRADPTRGRFRTYLLAALSNYLKDVSRTVTREKRGGSRVLLSLDFEGGEREYRQCSADADPPETILHRTWARSLLEQSLSELRGSPKHLQAFRLYVAGAGYRTISEVTGLSEAAAKTAVHRLKARLRDIVAGHLGATASSEEELKAELEDFLACTS